MKIIFEFFSSIIVLTQSEVSCDPELSRRGKQNIIYSVVAQARGILPVMKKSFERFRIPVKNIQTLQCSNPQIILFVLFDRIHIVVADGSTVFFIVFVICKTV